MITVQVFFSEERIFQQVRVTLWKSGTRFTVEREIDNGIYVYTITEYNCDASVIVNAFDEYFTVTVW